MTLEVSVLWSGILGGQGFRLRVMARAQNRGEVAQACREFGISRTPLCRWRNCYLACGPDGLHARPGRCPLGAVAGAQDHAERTLLALVLAWPIWDPVRLILQLRRPELVRLHVAPFTVRR